VGIDLSRESVPDATTLLKFRRLLLDNDLTKALFDEINAHLAEQGLLMRAGTIVDATIIAASSSTKNEGKARDPEMHQTKKGNAWHNGRLEFFQRLHKPPMTFAEIALIGGWSITIRPMGPSRSKDTVDDMKRTDVVWIETNLFCDARRHRLALPRSVRNLCRQMPVEFHTCSGFL
jgi:hypothetical protein